MAWRSWTNQNQTTKSSSTKKTFKIIVIGDGGVGKSSLCQHQKDLRQGNEKFDYYEQVSVYSMDYRRFNSQIHDTYRLWDTCGQEKYAAVGYEFYRGANAAIIMFNILSVNSIKKWYNEIITVNKKYKIPIVLGGTKCKKTDKKRLNIMVTGYIRKQKVIPMDFVGIFEQYLDILDVYTYSIFKHDDMVKYFAIGFDASDEDLFLWISKKLVLRTYNHNTKKDADNIHQNDDNIINNLQADDVKKDDEKDDLKLDQDVTRSNPNTINNDLMVNIDDNIWNFMDQTL